jgi:hypothetical protein
MIFPLRPHQVVGKIAGKRVRNMSKSRIFRGILPTSPPQFRQNG